MRRVTAVSTPIAHLVGPGKLKVINGQLAFTARDQGPIRLDPRALESVYCYGAVGITDEAFQVLFREQIQVSWLSPAGHRCQGRLAPADPATTLVRLRQHQRFADLAWRTDYARRIVQAKIVSQMDAGRHYQRHGCVAAGAVLERLRQRLADCAVAAGLDRLRGLEGSASADWFELLRQLLRAPWTFPGRNRRPPTDPVNALLSLGYTWLATRAEAVCTAAGLEVYLGTLHEFRPGRPSLACDLVEPFRVPAVDRWVVSLCNEGAIKPDHFVKAGEGVRLQPGMLPRMIHSWEEQWLTGGQDQALTALVAGLVQEVRQGWDDSPGSPVTVTPPPG